MVQKMVTKTLRLKTDRLCPKCGSWMGRIHRRHIHRALSMIVPVIRCECCGRNYLVLAGPHIVGPSSAAK